MGSHGAQLNTSVSHHWGRYLTHDIKTGFHAWTIVHASKLECDGIKVMHVLRVLLQAISAFDCIASRLSKSLTSLSLMALVRVADVPASVTSKVVMSHAASEKMST